MKVLRIVLFATLLAPPCRGGSGSWTSAGPTGGLVFSLAVDPSSPETIYTGTQVGIFKSTDGGASWAISSAGLPTRGRPAYALAISSSDPSTVFAGTVYAGAFKSTDAGASWASANSGLPDHATILTLAVDPGASEVLYAGGPGLFKSTDGGASWGRLSGGLPANATIHSVAIDPSAPDTLYAGTGGGTGSFKSSDGGQSWAAIGGGLGNCLVQLAVDTTQPSTVYAAGCGFSRSTDGGASWSTTLTDEVTSLAVDPSDGSTVLAADYFGSQVYRSTDAGASWDSLAAPEQHIRALAVAPAPVGGLLLGTLGCGVLESLDAGRTWVPSNAGLVNTYGSAVAVDPTEPKTLYAGLIQAPGFGSCGGVAKSTDGGFSWSRSDLAAQSISALAIDPSAPQTIYAGTGGTVNLLKSTDGGRSWQRPRPGYIAVQTSSLAIDPGDTRTLYAVVGDSQTTRHVMKSTDGGFDWQPRDGGLPIHQYFQISELAVSPSKLFAAGSLFAATSTGIFRSRDGGMSWQSLSAGLPQRYFATSVAVSPDDPRLVFAGIGFLGVYRSTDGGNSWTPASRGLPPLASVQAFAFDPVSPGTLYAGTFGVVNDADSAIVGKVFVSANGGGTWEEMNAGMPETSINALAIDSSGIALHAATQGNGVRDFAIPRRAAAAAGEGR